MKTQAEKMGAKRSKVVAGTSSARQMKSESVLQLEDRRTESEVQQTLEGKADKNSQTERILQLQAMADVTGANALEVKIQTSDARADSSDSVQRVIQREVTEKDILAAKEGNYDRHFRKVQEQTRELEAAVAPHEATMARLNPNGRTIKALRSHLSATEFDEFYDAYQKNKELGGKLHKFETGLSLISAASSQEERINILFECFGFDGAIAYAKSAVVESYKDDETMGAQVVLGRTDDTHGAAQTDREAFLVIDSRLYSIAANDAFMKQALDLKAEFKLLTPLESVIKTFLKADISSGSGPTGAQLMAKIRELKTAAGKALWRGDDDTGKPTISAREIAQALDDGYQYLEFTIDSVQVQKLVPSHRFSGLKPLPHSDQSVTKNTDVYG